MTPKVTLAELKEKLSVAPDATRKRMYFAAILREEGEISVDEFIVVGGSAIEIYTVGKYTSGDIDIVSSKKQQIARVLRYWKFQNHGRIWESADLQIVVDLVKDPYTGSADRTTLGTTPFGSVRLAAVEDLMIKRLSSFKHWKEKGDYEHALFLGLQFSKSIDWAYAEKFAQDHDVADLLAKIRKSIGEMAGEIL